MKKKLSWQWYCEPLNNRTGSEIFDTFFRRQNAIATLLESPLAPSGEISSLCRYSICAGSPRIVEGKPRIWTPVIGEIFPFLKTLLEYESQPVPEHLPFTGGWLGWLGYDCALEIEKLPYLRADNLPFPSAYWYEPENFAILDHQQQLLWFANSPASPLPLSPLSTPSSLSLPTFITNQNDYEAIVRQAKKYIQAGDIFQANLSLRFQSFTNEEPWSIYRRLQTINPSPFASYWQTPWGYVVSCSPERLVKLEDNCAQTRPIAGTRSRGVDPASDLALEVDLIGNLKERAEHIMLVDLERNDLGRVCEWGSIDVDELLIVERYSHVMHLVSNIKGNLKPEFDAIDLIKAMFPGGTITGCPKVRCMEIIEELEPVRRSLFYGSCGYLDWRGNLDLNILIRTLLLSPELLRSSTSDRPDELIVWGQVGAGIVADSDPEKEWYESLHKAQAQIKALQG